MNILVVHETEYIDKMIFEYQLIPELLATRGHQVFVIDYPTHWGKEKTGGLWLGPKRIEDVRRGHKEKGITLYRPGLIRIPVISRFSAFFQYYSLIDSVIRENQIDRILLFSAPTNGVQTILLAKKYHIPVMFRALDVLHQIAPNGLLRLPTRIAERIIYSNVDSISAITPKLVDYTIRLGAKRNRCTYLPTGADADVFHYQAKDPELMIRYGINPEDKVLLFAGTLYNFSGLGKIIQAFPKYVDRLPHLKLLLVGAGEQTDELTRLVKKLGLEKRVIFTGFIQYPELPKYVNLADICINPFDRNEITEIIFPSKVFQYLACEKPVIASAIGGPKEIIEGGMGIGTEVGILVPPADSNGIANAIIRLLDNPEKSRQMGTNARRYVERKYSWDTVCENTLEIYDFATKHHEKFRKDRP
jgi:glycosyltransferase involved in cell wall biosynthesis